MRWKLGILSLLLCDLAMAQSITSPEEAYARIQANMVGREVGEAFAIYGPPDGQTTIKGHTVYLWRHSRSLEFSRPQTTVTRGSVGDGTQYPYATSVPYVEYSTAQSWQTETYQCVLSLGTDDKGVIDAVGLGGKMGACQDFIR